MLEFIISSSCALLYSIYEADRDSTDFLPVVYKLSEVSIVIKRRYDDSELTNLLFLAAAS